mgnify:CR=1 FL=1
MINHEIYSSDTKANLYYAQDGTWVADVSAAHRFDDKTLAAVKGAQLLPIGQSVVEPVLN